MGEMLAMEMCAPRGPGCTWCVHEGRGQQQQWPMVHGLGAEAAACMGCKGQQRQHVEAVASGEAGGGGT